MSNGIVSIPSSHSVAITVEKIQALLAARNITLFALVDHSGEAARAGLAMPDTKLLIFGSPKAGTPLMLSAPSTALDLPLKLLVAEDAAGSVTISYNDAVWLQQRHGFTPDLTQNVAVISALAKAASE